ncbi:MAG: glycerol kinase GlpK [Actinobacteria bacterium]|uniref:glycerol kinase n=1 Tax=freshwater metagenome TaxID=449393 RepID=A0A6J6DBX8_9ZZZZ|nr:glycerol kinase GlpK [Actinomycetota bacterium]
MAILAIDAGTTGVTVQVVSTKGKVLARGYREFLQYFPEPGLVEHEPEEIWQATLAAASEAISQTTVSLVAIGITNQRETVVLWDSKTLRSPRKAIVWQDRRTADLVAKLKAQGLEDKIQNISGLKLDPYFSSSKLLWLSQNEKTIWGDVVSGQIKIGTVDSYLVARMTSGISHITDASNASRTQLMDIRTGNWSAELLEIFHVPVSALPLIVPSYGKFATTDPASFLNLELPITGIAGDQQAALFGQTAFEIGESKCTYGTGAFMLTNTGSKVVQSKNNLLTTIAWQEPNGDITYALEGSVFVAGAAVQWLRDGLGVIESANEIEELALQVPDSGGVVFVPALTGLGAPHWNPDAKGTILGITRGTTKHHLARATLDAIAFQVRDLVTAISADTNVEPKELRVDGGAARNNLLMQLQANCLGVPVIRGKDLESTALGAAFLAGIGVGVWSTKEELRNVFELERTFNPEPYDEQIFASWSEAVKLSSNWK